MDVVVIIAIELVIVGLMYWALTAPCNRRGL